MHAHHLGRYLRLANGKTVFRWEFRWREEGPEGKCIHGAQVN